jgi:hypothetical protein
MAAAGALTPRLRAATYQTLIGLLKVTGLFSRGHRLRHSPCLAFAQLRG